MILVERCKHAESDQEDVRIQSITFNCALANGEFSDYYQLSDLAKLRKFNWN